MNSGDANYSATNTVLAMQTDGNLVLYHTFQWYPYSTAVWHTYTVGNPGADAVFQTDGNLVVYSSSGSALWHAGTHGNPNSTMVLTDDGNFQIFSPYSTLLFSSWTSRTPGCCGAHPAGEAPFNLRWANGYAHRWGTSESDAYMRNEWNWRFAGPGGEDNFEPTDLTFTFNSPVSSTTDVVCYVTTLMDDPNNAAETECTIAGTGNRCNRWSVRINQTAPTQSLPSHMKNNLVCHELGHTVGFGGGGSTGSSCLTSGQNSRLGWWEGDTINATY